MTDDQQSFTSWKLTVLDALTCDATLEPIIDRLVAIRLLQHVNRRDMTANPSISRIAAQLGKSEDTVKRSLKRLVEKHHWLDRDRPSRTSVYTYRFNETKKSAVLDAKLQREEIAADALRRKKEAFVNAPRSGSCATSRGGKQLRVEVADSYKNEVAPVHPEHLHRNYLNEHLTQGYEDRATPYAKAKGKGKVA